MGRPGKMSTPRAHDIGVDTGGNKIKNGKNGKRKRGNRFTKDEQEKLGD